MKVISMFSQPSALRPKCVIYLKFKSLLTFSIIKPLTSLKLTRSVVAAMFSETRLRNYMMWWRVILKIYSNRKLICRLVSSPSWKLMKRSNLHNFMQQSNKKKTTTYMKDFLITTWITHNKTIMKQMISQEITDLTMLLHTKCTINI